MKWPGQFIIFTSVFCLLMALMVFLGYLTDFDATYRFFKSGPATHPLTAICILFLTLSTLATCSSFSKTAMVFVFPVLGISLLRCLDVVLETHLSDSITPFHSTVTAQNKSGLNNEMGFNTAITFTLIAMALFFRQCHRFRLSQFFGYWSLFLPFLSIQGYILSIENFYGQMAVLTTLCGCLLAANSLLLTREHWVLKSILGNSPGSKVARYQLFAMLIFPSVFGYALPLFDQTIYQQNGLAAIAVVSFVWFAITLLSVTTLLLVKQEQTTSDALRQANINHKKFGAIFEHSPVSKLLIDTNGRIKMINKAAEEMLGYSIEELFDHTIEKLVPRSVSSKHIGYREGYLASVEERHLMNDGKAVDVATKSGNKLLVQVWLVKIATDEGPHFVMALIDQTASILQMKELSRSNKELEQFAYLASHDLRSPLNTVGSMAQFIEEDLGDKLTGETKTYMLHLRERVSRLQQLITDLLAYSRAGKKESEPMWLSLTEEIADVVNLYVPTDRIKIDFKSQLPSLFISRTLLNTILRNILMNSVKHHDKATGTITLQHTVNEEGITLSISDDGPGIPEDKTHYVFELFSSLKPKSHTKSSGIGLATVYKLIQQIDGEITILPNSPTGVEFKLLFPVPYRE